MNIGLRALRKRLSSRPDSEHAQAIIRVAMLGVVFGYLLLMVKGQVDEPRALALSLSFLALEFVIAAGILAWLVADPGKSAPRRLLGMLADYSLTGVGLWLLGEHGSPLYVIIVWVTVGNGLRYGPRYLYLAIAFAIVSFLPALLGTSYWRENPWLGWALLAALVAVPLYLSSLLHALTKATHAARVASEAKGRFLANMSHELRTPLNGIVGMSELLMASTLNVEQRENAQVMQASARALQRLVDEVLDLSAIEAGKLHHEESDFHLQELLGSLHLMLSQSAKAKGLTFEISRDPSVPNRLHGDSQHLSQILVNLLSNAIKFTERGKVTLEVLRLEDGDTGDARLRFSVRDSGIGIPADKLGRLFDAFEQVDTGRDRMFGGTGLGTTIAKALAEQLGGVIGVESTVGIGSHFWADLPFQLPAQKDDTPSSNVISFGDPFIRHRARVRSMQILVADDQSANLMVMRRLLEKAGHRPTLVNDGEDVLNAIELQSYDLVIIDLHMPGISGLDVIKQARFMQAGQPRIPFVVVSADATAAARLECERAGASAFLTKPVAVDRLLEQLASIAAGLELPEARIIPQASTLPDEDFVSRNMLDELKEIGMGEEFVTKFLNECAQDARRCLHGLEQALLQRKWDEFRDASHALKGIAASMGANALANTASLAMRMDNAALTGEAQRILLELRAMFEQALAALRQRGNTIHDAGHDFNA